MAQSPQSHNNELITYVKTKWGTEAPSAVVAQIAKGDRLATEALGLSPNAKYRSQVVQAGALDKLLEFIIKTDKPFREVLPQSDGISQIPCPSIWLNVLNNFCQDGFVQPQSLCRNTQYKIIINMGPLFQDMSNFDKREIYGTRDIWIKSLLFFTNILYSLVSSSFERIGDFLLKQKLLKGFLVRVLFLEIGGPDIAKEISDFQARDDRMPPPDVLGLSQSFCASAIKTIMTKRGPSNPTIVEEFAGTPIGPENEVFLMTGLLKLLQQAKREGWFQGGYSNTLNIFFLLFDKADRLSGPFQVDSASEVMVTICRQHLLWAAPRNRDRFFVENVMTGLVTIGGTMITPNIGGKQAPIDYSVAKAIRAGLFDYICECCDANEPRTATALEGLTKTVAATVILDDTMNALQELGPRIRAKAERVKDRHPLLLPPLALVEDLLKNPMVKPPLGEDTCAFCQEKTSAPDKQLEKCPFCKTIVYCSKDCLRLNWMIHQMECAEKRKEPVAQSADMLMDVGKQLFGLHISKMLLQASLKGYPILDCITTIDMCEVTPLLKTFTLEQYSSAYIQDEEAVTFVQKVLDRNKAKGALTVSFVGFSETEGFNGNLMTFPPDTAPKSQGVLKAQDADKWRMAQQEVTRATLGQSGVAAQMQKNPRMWQAALMKTMKP